MMLGTALAGGVASITSVARWWLNTQDAVYESGINPSDYGTAECKEQKYPAKDENEKASQEMHSCLLSFYYL